LSAHIRTNRRKKEEEEEENNEYSERHNCWLPALVTSPSILRIVYFSVGKKEEEEEEVEGRTRKKIYNSVINACTRRDSVIVSVVLSKMLFFLFQYIYIHLMITED
jgi:hypothetical protein